MAESGRERSRNFFRIFAPPGPSASLRLCARNVWVGGCGSCLVALLLLASAAGAGERAIRLTPATGLARGGTTVRLELEGGSIFGSVQVRFGDQAAPKVRRLGMATLEVVTPPGEPGPVAVQVVNRLWGTTTVTAVFTYTESLPQVVRVTPSTLPAGSGDVRLEVEAVDVPPDSVVVANDTRLPTTFLPPRGFHAIVPGSLLTGPGSLALRIVLAGPTGEASEAVTLEVVNPSPSITGIEVRSFSATAATAPLIVRGTGFRPESRIHLADEPTATRYRSAEELESDLPAALLSRVDQVPVVVVTPEPGGGISNPWTLKVVAPPPPPPPPPPPRIAGRFVVFTSNRQEGRNHLFLLDRETGQLDPLPEANSPGANDAYPAISGDGRYIVFQSDRRGQSDIFLFDRVSRSLDPLPEANHPTAFDGFPSISPDGRIIVFESDRVDRKPRVFLFDRESRALSELIGANQGAADDGLAAVSN